MFNPGDFVRYTGPCKLYPVDSTLAEKFLEKDSVYLVEKVVGSLPPHVELKLVAVNVPFVSVLFKKV